MSGEVTEVDAPDRLAWTFAGDHVSANDAHDGWAEVHERYAERFGSTQDPDDASPPSCATRADHDAGTSKTTAMGPRGAATFGAASRAGGSPCQAWRRRTEGARRWSRRPLRSRVTDRESAGLTARTNQTLKADTDDVVGPL